MMLMCSPTSKALGDVIEALKRKTWRLLDVASKDSQSHGDRHTAIASCSRGFHVERADNLKLYPDAPCMVYLRDKCW